MYIRPGLLQKDIQIIERLLDPKPLLELLGHELFSVANSDNLAPRNPQDLRDVRVGDFAATNDGDFKHGLWLGDNPRRTA